MLITSWHTVTAFYNPLALLLGKTLRIKDFSGISICLRDSDSNTFHSKAVLETGNGGAVWRPPQSFICRQVINYFLLPGFSGHRTSQNNSQAPANNGPPGCGLRGSGQLGYLHPRSKNPPNMKYKCLLLSLQTFWRSKRQMKRTSHAYILEIYEWVCYWGALESSLSPAATDLLVAIHSWRIISLGHLSCAILQTVTLTAAHGAMGSGVPGLCRDTSDSRPRFHAMLIDGNTPLMERWPPV